MPANLSAEIVSIGTEILLGEITDTNSVFLARTLRDLGINIYYMISVGDNVDRIADVIRTSLSRSDIVITCGGLGPTVDDMTRQGIANATDRKLVYQQSLYDMIAERFNTFNVTMSENNRRQAYLPENAITIMNPVGTAPSFAVELDDKVVISLPGVPREMKFLMQEKVIPYLRERYQISEQIIAARILKTAGIGESALDDRLGESLLNGSNPTIGLAAHSGQIDIRITVKADTRLQADKLIADIESQVKARVGEYIFGTDDDQLEAVLAQLLIDSNSTLALSETGTNLMIYQRLQPALADRITAAENHPIPQLLAEQLNLPDDSSLQMLAEQAATTQRVATGSTISIAVVSQPTAHESEDHNVGTAVAICTEKGIRHRVYGFGGLSENLQQFVGNWSTAVAWRMLKEALND